MVAKLKRLRRFCWSRGAPSQVSLDEIGVFCLLSTSKDAHFHGVLAANLFHGLEIFTAFGKRGFAVCYGEELCMLKFVARIIVEPAQGAYRTWCLQDPDGWPSMGWLATRPQCMESVVDVDIDMSRTNDRLRLDTSSIPVSF